MPQGSGHQADDACTAGTRAEKLYIACDADPAVLAPIEALAREENIAIDDRATMAQLGHSAGIAVGAAVIAVLRN